MKKLKKLILINSIILAVAVLFVFYVLLSFESFLNTPNSQITKKVYLEIAPGTNIISISDKLQKAKLVKRSDWFYYYVRLSGKSQDVKAGMHLFYTNYTPKQILAELIGKSKNSVVISIPPGYNVEKVAKELTQLNFDGSKFYKLANSKELVYKLIGYNTNSIEGFLGVGEYFVEKNEKPAKLLELMVEQFRLDYRNIANFKKLDKSLYDKVIVASLIEKEAKVNPERPLIASVIYNRLQKNMLLQIDSSVIYGIKNFDGKLTINDLENRKNLYNTYVYKKLPPTPICSPSYESLEAAFHPAKTHYLYFVSKNNGKHVFSKDLKQQDHWVDVYQKGNKK